MLLKVILSVNKPSIFFQVLRNIIMRAKLRIPPLLNPESHFIANAKKSEDHGSQHIIVALDKSVMVQVSKSSPQSIDLWIQIFEESEKDSRRYLFSTNRGFDSRMRKRREKTAQITIAEKYLSEAKI